MVWTHEENMHKYLVRRSERLTIVDTRRCRGRPKIRQVMTHLYLAEDMTLILDRKIWILRIRVEGQQLDYRLLLLLSYYSILVRCDASFGLVIISFWCCYCFLYFLARLIDYYICFHTFFYMLYLSRRSVRNNLSTLKRQG